MESQLANIMEKSNIPKTSMRKIGKDNANSSMA